MNKESQKVIFATGRRKEAVARVRLVLEGEGKIKVNGKDYVNYFPTLNLQNQIKKPLAVTEMEGKVDVLASLKGGGVSGQAGALTLGIARCLVEFEPKMKTILRQNNLLTRDPRAKERKKYGRKGARRRFQWTKR